MKKKKNNYRIFLKNMGRLFFRCLLLFLIAGILLPDRGFSQKENRVLSKRPRLSLSAVGAGSYEKEYETYVNDQFPLRDLWVSLKAGTDLLLGKKEGNGVYLGKDGYLMEAFQAPDEKRLESTEMAMTAFAKRHSELKQYALIAPNAVNILKDKLPEDLPAKDQNPYLDQVNSVLEAAGVTVIDVRERLSAHKEEGIFYHTDHHWTSKSAYLAYLDAAKAMGLNSGEISYEKVPVTDSFQGTLSAKSGFRSGEKEEMDVFLPREDGDEEVPGSIVNYVEEQEKTTGFYDTKKLEGRDKYAMFLGGNHSLVKISTPVEEDRKLLILKDSYANSMIPFLAPHYRSIVVVDPRYYYGDLEELLKVEEITEVLYLYNANTFFGDTSLELALSTE